VPLAGTGWDQTLLGPDAFSAWVALVDVLPQRGCMSDIVGISTFSEGFLYRRGG